MDEKLSRKQVEQRLAAWPEWTRSGESIQRTYQFEDFPAAIAFVNRVAGLAESRDHHPGIMVRCTKVTLTLTTADAGGVTDRDFEFARATDVGLAVERGATAMHVEVGPVARVEARRGA